MWSTADEHIASTRTCDSNLVLINECKDDFETRYENGSKGITRGKQFDHLNRLLKDKDYLD